VLTSRSVFHEGLARMIKKGKWGFIDRNGGLAIDHKFDQSFDFSEGLAAVHVGDTYGFMALSRNS
jgi:hypothetical protein